MMIPAQPNPDPRVYVAVREERGNSETISLFCAPTEADAERIGRGETIQPMPLHLKPHGLYEGRGMNFGYSGGGPNALDDAIAHDLFAANGVAGSRGAGLGTGELMMRTFSRLISLSDAPMTRIVYTPDTDVTRRLGKYLLFRVHEFKRALTAQFDEGGEGVSRLTRAIVDLSTFDRAKSLTAGGLASSLIESSYLEPAQAVRHAHEAILAAGRIVESYANNGQPVERLTWARFVRDYQPVKANYQSYPPDSWQSYCRPPGAADELERGYPDENRIWTIFGNPDGSTTLRPGPPAASNSVRLIGYVFTERPYVPSVPAEQDDAILVSAGPAIVEPDDNQSDEAKVCSIVSTLQRMAEEPERSFREATRLRDEANRFISTYSFRRVTDPEPARPKLPRYSSSLDEQDTENLNRVMALLDGPVGERISREDYEAILNVSLKFAYLAKAEEVAPERLRHSR